MHLAYAQPSCTPLRYHEVVKATAVRDAAFEPLPLLRYLLDTPDARETRLTKLVRRAAAIMHMASYVRNREGWVIDGGEAIMCCRRAPNSIPEPRRTLERTWFKMFMRFYSLLLTSVSSKEQKARELELQTKAEVAAKIAIGDPSQYLEVFGLDTLAVAPGKQGLGYGSALVDDLTTIADVQGRRILLSTHLETAGFYEQFGFVIKAGFLLGELNPTWTKAPVHMVIMIREPRKPGELYCEKAFV